MYMLAFGFGKDMRQGMPAVRQCYSAGLYDATSYDEHTRDIYASVARQINLCTVSYVAAIPTELCMSARFL
jgi:predicted kinase